MKDIDYIKSEQFLEDMRQSLLKSLCGVIDTELSDQDKKYVENTLLLNILEQRTLGTEFKIVLDDNFRELVLK